MYNILTLNKIAPAGLAEFEHRYFSVSDSVEAPDGIIVRSKDMLEYDFNENLRAIARAGAGTNNIPIDRCSEAGIVVFNSPGANANAVKELVVCAMLLASRDIFSGITWANSLTPDSNVEDVVEKGKSAFVGPELAGKTLGVIGLGAVGVLVANVANRLGMKVLGYDPYLSVDHALSLNSAVSRVNDLKSLYEKADYITVHSPLTPDTKGMLNAEAFAIMKHGVRIINLARGGLVDDDDILMAIESGKVARYVTDFPDAKLLGHKNIILIPHLGASTPESEENCAVMAAKELSEYLRFGTIRNSVNLPNVEMERTGHIRLGIIHRNIPNMLNNIFGTLSSEGVNIENLINRSKGAYAYTLVDFGGDIPNPVVQQVKDLPDVLRVRVIR
ncbi:MAG: 3-phosphoglycerate dehydrogenase [Ruminococcaceae bacterium]|nr:3-phosphoglycerate dehydrogenase [Oscillospiraceae bacterium]